MNNYCMTKKAAPELGEYHEFASRVEAALARILPARKKNYSIQEKARILGFSKSFMALDMRTLSAYALYPCPTSGPPLGATDRRNQGTGTHSTLPGGFVNDGRVISRARGKYEHISN